MLAKSPAAIRSSRGKYEAPTSSAAVSLFLDSLVLAYGSLERDTAMTVNMELFFATHNSSNKNGAPFQEALSATLTAGLQETSRTQGDSKRRPTESLPPKLGNRILPKLQSEVCR